MVGFFQLKLKARILMNTRKFFAVVLLAIRSLFQADNRDGSMWMNEFFIHISTLPH